jgi:hypothetical protein
MYFSDVYILTAAGHPAGWDHCNGVRYLQFKDAPPWGDYPPYTCWWQHSETCLATDGIHPPYTEYWQAGLYWGGGDYFVRFWTPIFWAPREGSILYSRANAGGVLGAYSFVRCVDTNPPPGDVWVDCSGSLFAKGGCPAGPWPGTVVIS